jgi:uncharacterized membrane protein YphA (DoxX/SURF4 family)
MTNKASVWGIRLIQFYTGMAFLIHGIQKIMGGWLVHPKILTGMIQYSLKTPTIFPFYRHFLTKTVLPHPVIFSVLVAGGETAVGLALAAGVFARFAALMGMTMMANYWMMHGSPISLLGLDQAYFFLFFACLIGGERWLFAKRQPDNEGTGTHEIEKEQEQTPAPLV